MILFLIKKKIQIINYNKIFNFKYYEKILKYNIKRLIIYLK